MGIIIYLESIVCKKNILEVIDNDNRTEEMQNIIWEHKMVKTGYIWER